MLCLKCLSRPLNSSAVYLQLQMPQLMYEIHCNVECRYIIQNVCVAHYRLACDWLSPSEREDVEYSLAVKCKSVQGIPE